MQAPFDREQENNRKPRTPLRAVAVLLLCLLAVLIVAYLQALLAPLQRLNSVLAPLTIGFVMAYLLNPILCFFQNAIFFKIKRRRANRALSMLCTYLVFFAMVAGIFYLIIPQVVDSINDFSANGLSYVERVIDSVNRLLSYLPLQGGKGEDGLLTLEQVLNYFIGLFGTYSSNIINWAGSFAGGALTVLKNILVGIFISIYVLFAKERLAAGARRVIRALCSPRNEHYLLYYSRKAHVKFGGFFIGKIVDSILIGLLSGAVFHIFRIPYATLVAVIVGVTNIIPFFGPFIGAIPSAVLIFIASPPKALLFALLILIIQQFDGNLLGPLILGNRTGLSSLGVLIAITVMSGLFGFGGMLIGVPLFALLIAILEDIIVVKLMKKGSSRRLYDYYPADAFLRPDDETQGERTLTARFKRWVRAVRTERAGVDYKPSFFHSVGRAFRISLLAMAEFLDRVFNARPLTAASNIPPPQQETPQEAQTEEVKQDE